MVAPFSFSICYAMQLFLFRFLILINLISGALFAYDKHAAIGHKYRIAERTLHLLELCGGVFVIWGLMYLLHHKNRKFSYYSITYLILAGWLVALYYITAHL